MIIKNYTLLEVEDKSDPVKKVTFMDWHPKKKRWVGRDSAPHLKRDDHRQKCRIRIREMRQKEHGALIGEQYEDYM